MRHRAGHEYESSSMISSDLESTSFVDSEEDASSRITTTTGKTIRTLLSKIKRVLDYVPTMQFCLFPLMFRIHAPRCSSD